MEPLSPITLPIRLTATAIIVGLSAIVVGLIVYGQDQSSDEDVT